MAGSLTYGYTQAQQFDIGNKWEWVDLLKDFLAYGDIVRFCPCSFCSITAIESRHFKVIIVLGFGTCQLGYPKGMISNLQHCLGSNTMKPAYLMVYQEYIKVLMDKYLLVLLHSAPGTCKARTRIKTHAKA
jgi:hypothetical protein